MASKPSAAKRSFYPKPIRCKRRRKETAMGPNEGRGGERVYLGGREFCWDAISLMCLQNEKRTDVKIADTTCSQHSLSRSFVLLVFRSHFSREKLMVKKIACSLPCSIACFCFWWWWCFLLLGWEPFSPLSRSFLNVSKTISLQKIEREREWEWESVGLLFWDKCVKNKCLCELVRLRC